MIDRLRAMAAQVWPVMRLRWVLFGTLLFVAALPGVAALGLRVYENALVRRTEAEVIAQAAALAASAAVINSEAMPSAGAGDIEADGREAYEDVSTEIDLSSSPVLPERPAARATAARPDPVLQALAIRMGPALAETKRATLASILLLDRQGILLNGRDAGRSLAHLPEVRAALEGKPLTVLRYNDFYTLRYPLEWVSRATSIRLHHARPIVLSGRPAGVILVSRSPRALFRGMWEDRGKIAAGTGAIFLLLVLLTAIFARAVVSPVEKLSEAARALARGQMVNPRRPTLQVAEIRSLFDDFAAMAAAIARRSRYLRDFAASLAHEFKTPLAGLRGGIELLQDHGETMQPEERRRFLANMGEDAERLSRLVSRLMELAKADMASSGAGGGSGARADLAPILARLADAMTTETFAIRASGPGLAVAMDGAALETVLATLIENARQAGAAGLAITVRRDGDRGEIALADNGPGIPQGDRDRVFDPFFTSRRAEGGTGLGLPIARALVENHGGSLELAGEGPGACFVMRLPLATGA